MKIKCLLFLTLTAPALFMLHGCNADCKKGSGNQTTEVRKVANFTSLDISGGYKVTIKQDTAASIAVTADDNLIKYVKTEVNGDKLTIKSTNNLCSSGQFAVNITLRNLQSVKTSGSVDITSDGKLTVKDLELNLSGATKVNLNLNAGNVTTASSGVAELNLTGQASAHVINFSGSGHLNAFDFVVGKYRIESSGMSHCQINVLNELSVSSSGTSDVEYRGNPTKINNDKSGASTLKKVN